MKLDVRCLHESAGISTDTTVPDFDPLTLQEVRDLLEMARGALKAGDWKTANRIQIRLCKAVPDSVCPHDIDNETWRRRTNKVSDLYLGWCQGTIKIPPVEQIFKAFNG